MPVGLVMVMVFGLAFGVGGLAILLEHLQKMAKIKAESNRVGSAEVAQAIDSLRKEIADLRDTTTKYDLSFDSALQRLEGRVGRLEEAQRAKPAVADQAALRQTAG